MEKKEQEKREMKREQTLSRGKEEEIKATKQGRGNCKKKGEIRREWVMRRKQTS